MSEKDDFSYPSLSFAFDAAVATAAATSVVDPFNSSLGGNGFATAYVVKSREVRTLNFFGTAPPPRDRSSSLTSR